MNNIRELAWKIKLLIYELEENGDLNSLSPLRALDTKLNPILQLFDTALYNEYYATGIRYIDGEFYQVYFGWKDEDNIKNHLNSNDEDFNITCRNLNTTLQKTYNNEKLKHPPIKELLEALWLN